MIVSNMTSYERYCTNEDFKSAFEFLKNTDLEALEKGKTIISENVFAIKSSYKTYHLGETAWEAHENFIDIQYIFKGTELIGYSPIDKLKTSLYFEPKDVKLCKGEIDTFIELKAGEYAIFFPEDAHMPSLSPSECRVEVTKIVVKVRV